jgi:DNA polymerase iota
MDVTDMIDHNVGLLNPNDLVHSFFCLDQQDPTQGFEFDATKFYGPTFPSPCHNPPGGDRMDLLTCRLVLGSHLAHYIRSSLDHECGYTATVGISTSKLLAKLVGNVNKPDSQTTLIPPYTYSFDNADLSNVIQFIDDHEVGKIPGIGFKSAHKLRTYFLRREPISQPYTERDHNDQVKVRDLRLSPGMGAPKLLDILGGAGAPKDNGVRIWELLNGVDNSEVLEARAVPTQISIEDSYQGINHFEEAKKKLQILATSLVKRMRTDLVEVNDDGTGRWLAHPRTLRLSTRQRSPRNADGSREYSYANGRISRSAPAPSFLFNLGEGIESIAEKLVEESLVSMFRKLHPEKSFGELSLINIAVTNMVESAGDQKQSIGRDIGQMFKNQESSLRKQPEGAYSDRQHQPSQKSPPSWEVNTPLDEATWEESEDEDESPLAHTCDICGAHIPAFALPAHALYHAAPD